MCVCVCVCVCDFSWAEIMCFKLGPAGIHFVKKSNNIGGKFSKHLKISQGLEVRVGEAFCSCTFTLFPFIYQDIGLPHDEQKLLAPFEELAIQLIQLDRYF